MKALNNGGELIKTPLCVKISILLFLCVAFFLLGKHWSDISHRHELLFFSTTSTSPSVSISPNFNKFFDISSLINSSQTNSSSPNSPRNGGSSLSSPAPAPEKVVKVGIVSENGTMTEDFEVGEYDPTVVENWGNGTGSENDESETRVRVRVHKFPLCLDSLREYIPCVDNEEAIRQLKSTERGERFERHCPEKGKELSCLVPAPKNYKIPIPWPRSRDEVWYFNVPHTRLVEDKGGQNWITRDKDKFKFPGGGTQFIHGADGYLDQISWMLDVVLRALGLT